MSFPTLSEVVMMIPGVVMGFTFHEFGHAWVATRFGDDTPRLMGRVTLNPRAHLDPLGTILLLIGWFGWAKPVQVNPDRMRPRVLGDICVSLAGVTMNFLLAVLFAILTMLAMRYPVFGAYQSATVQVLTITMGINIWLVGFNILPLPPLDGFHVVRYLFPRSMDNVVFFLMRYGYMILIVLFMSGYGSALLGPVYRAIGAAVFAIARLIV